MKLTASLPAVAPDLGAAIVTHAAAEVARWRWTLARLLWRGLTRHEPPPAPLAPSVPADADRSPLASAAVVPSPLAGEHAPRRRVWPQRLPRVPAHLRRDIGLPEAPPPDPWREVGLWR